MVPQIIKKETKSHGSSCDSTINHKETTSHDSPCDCTTITRKQHHMVPDVIAQLSQGNNITWVSM